MPAYLNDATYSALRPLPPLNMGRCYSTTTPYELHSLNNTRGHHTGKVTKHMFDPRPEHAIQQHGQAMGGNSGRPGNMTSHPNPLRIGFMCVGFGLLKPAKGGARKTKQRQLLLPHPTSHTGFPQKWDNSANQPTNQPTKRPTIEQGGRKPPKINKHQH